MFIPHALLVQHTGADSVADRRHIIRGLVHEGLLAPKTDPQALAFDPRAQGAADGVILAGSALGAELFLWVHGARNAAPEMVCLNSTPLRDWDGSNIDSRGVLGARRLEQQRQTAGTLEEIRMCDAAEINTKPREAVIAHIRSFMKTNNRFWLPRDLRHWLGDLRLVDEPANIVELKRQLERAISLLAKYQR